MPNSFEQEYERDFDGTVVRYFSGRLSEPARAAFAAWLDEMPSRRARVERLRAIWEASADVAPESDADPELDRALTQMKQCIRARQAAASSGTPVLKLEPTGRSVRRSWRAIVRGLAAAAAVMAGGALLWHAGWLGAVSETWHLTSHTYTTGRGERLVVNLSDGSIVTLHNESALEVPRTFGAGGRDVRLLRGEGYFEVAHDPSRPFQVHANDAITRVLGTKFSVRARPDDDAIRVAVVEGRVVVGVRRIDRSAPVLTAGQVARLRDDGDVTVQSGVDVSRLLSWTSGRLVFDHAPVLVVLADLSRWFDRDFVLGDSALAGAKLTTALGGHSLAEAITVLETALEVHATVDGRRIVLTRS